MTLPELKTLIQDDTKNIIHENLENDPTKVALKVKEHGALIATQVKYLQRARTKLPSYYQAQCVIPSLAFEQCSSELTAATKQHVGELCIDLTCGLGVDSLYLSKGFGEVISLEQDELLAEVAKHNFSLLGAANIKVINTSAEDFIETLYDDRRMHSWSKVRFEAENDSKDGNGSKDKKGREAKEAGCGEIGELSADIKKIDLIYVDPARRGAKGNKLFLLEECSPNVIDLMPKLLQLSNCVVVKASPLFDIDEAIKIFAPLGVTITVEVVSLDGECKELLIELKQQARTDHNLLKSNTPEPLIKTTIAGRGSLTFCNGNIICDSDTQAVGSSTVSAEEDGTSKKNAERSNSSTESAKENGTSKKSTERSNSSTEASAEGGSSKKNRDRGVVEESISKKNSDETNVTAGSANSRGADTGSLSTTVHSQQFTKHIFSPPYTHLLIPDVTLYKARLTVQYISTQSAYLTSPIGYGLTNSPTPHFWGQQHPIQDILPYQPRKLKALLKQKGINRAVILKKDFPHDADTIAKALGIKLGGATKIAFTRINNSPYAIILHND